MELPESISLDIREIHQTHSLDHVTVFRAEVQLLRDQQDVRLETLDLDIDALSGLGGEELLEVLEYIRQGVKAVVETRGLGAYVLVSDLRIHEIDFWAQSFERYTKKYLEKALASLELPGDDSQ